MIKAITVVLIIFFALIVTCLISAKKESLFTICFRHGSLILCAWGTVFYICKIFKDCVPAGNIYNENAILISGGTVIIIILGGLVLTLIGVLMCISEIEKLKETKNNKS